MARRRVWAFGFGHIAGCEAPAGPHGPQKQMASTVTYWAICASASNSLTRDAHVTDDTARHLRYTSRAKREADGLAVAPCTMMQRVFVGGGRVQAEEGQQRYTSRTTPHVTCVTRHAQNAKPTSRCRTVAPWSIPLHHGAPRCDGCYHPETDGES